MTNYERMYRLGYTPWERYARVSAQSIGAVLDRATERFGTGRFGTGRSGTGRALDLGCGRGHYATMLADRGWEVVGVDLAESAIARARPHPRVRYLVADVTDLPADEWGRFDLILDIGCFQGLGPDQRAAVAAGLDPLTGPGSGLLLLAFGPSRWSRLVEGVSQTEVIDTFGAWTPIRQEPAVTAGLGFPMNRTRPQWYWFGR